MAQLGGRGVKIFSNVETSYSPASIVITEGVTLVGKVVPYMGAALDFPDQAVHLHPTWCIMPIC